MSKSIYKKPLLAAMAVLISRADNDLMNSTEYREFAETLLTLSKRCARAAGTPGNEKVYFDRFFNEAGALRREWLGIVTAEQRTEDSRRWKIGGKL